MRIELQADEAPTFARAYLVAKGAKVALVTVCPECRTTSRRPVPYYEWVECERCGERRALTWGTRGSA